jgi:single-stranded-DNA-specific exonuclease
MKPQRVTREWRIAPIDYSKTTELARALHVPPMVAHLLTQRGVTTVEDGERFLNPSTDRLCDPFSLRDMQRAVARIAKARGQREHVVVFGDYDVDGMAATAVMVRALMRYGIQDCTFALPGRLVEGYGLAPQHVEEAHRQGASLIITVDNGISAHEAAREAKRLGIDLIVTDHHAITGELPEAFAIISPKREGEDHPAANLSGSAVAFKLACALNEAIHDLDIVALGLVADIVPLRGENRDIVALGLRQLASRPSQGLLKLAHAAGLMVSNLTAEDIAFQIAPRLNADGRLGNGMTAVQLLLTDDPAEAAKLAAKLDQTNQERRALEATLFEEAVAELERTHDADQRSIVLAGEGWHPGIVGVVASRLRGRYGRPVIMLSVNGEGVARGSARTVEGFDLMGVLEECREHLVTYGGHYTAAGLTVGADCIDALREAFERQAVKRLPEGGVREVLEIDGLVSLSQIDVRFVKALDALEPFGSGNPSPLFACCGITPLRQSLKQLNGGHLRFSVKSGPRVNSAVAFGMGDRLGELETLEACDIAFTPRLKTYRGQTGIELIVKDLRPCPEGEELDSAEI